MTDKIDSSAEQSAGGIKRSSSAHKILHAGLVVAFAHIALKLISPIQLILVGQLATDPVRDIFIFAMEGILLTLFLVGEESLGPAFLPIFMHEKENNGERAAWRFTNTILTIQLVLIAGAVAIVAIWPRSVVALFTKWNEPGAEPIYMELAPLVARYMVVGLFGLSLGSTTYMLLNGYKRFFLAAFGDASFKLGIVAALVVAWVLHFDLHGMAAVYVFGLGTVLGSVLKLGTHLVGLRDKVSHFKFELDLKNPAVRQFLVLVAPLLLGIVFARIRDIYNNLYVMSELDVGVMSATAFGRKLYQTISFVGPYAVSIAMLPFFCEMVARKQKEELGRMLTHGSRIIMLTCVPLTVLLMTLSLPIVQVLFQGGQFSFEASRQAAVANACYTLVLPFAALECMYMQTFFANRRMILVTVMGLLFSFLSMVISYFFVIHLGWTGLHAVAAVSLAFTLSRFLKVLVLGGMLKILLPCFPVREVVDFLWRIIVLGGGVGLTAYGVRKLYEIFAGVPMESDRLLVLTRVAPALILAGLAAGVVTIVLAWLLFPQDSTTIMNWALTRLGIKKEKGR